MRLRNLVIVPALVASFVAPAIQDARAEIEPDEHGVSLEVPRTTAAHRLWVGDRLFCHSILFDGDDGRALGMVDHTFNLGGVTPYSNPVRDELYVIEAVYSRGHRGDRTDYVTIYETSRLEPIGEIALPTKSAEVGHGVALAAVLDGGRFLVIFNQTPATSVTVVDLQRRRFAGEIQTAGCALVYPTGERRFGMLCGDGTALQVELSEDGSTASTERSAAFFDVVADPVTEKAVRDGSRWLFASFEGKLHAVDFADATPRPAPPWALIDDGDRADDYRVGGNQYLALHRATRRLYAVVHEGGPGSHKAPGKEVWVYDVDSHERIQKIAIPSLLPAFIGPIIGVETGSLTSSLLQLVMPNLGVHSILVTQDEEPLLFVRNNEIGAIGVHDALSGERLRAIEEAGISGGLMTPP